MAIGNSRLVFAGVGLIVIICGTFATAQQNPAATIRFTLDFPASDPMHYEVSIISDGHGSYSSQTKQSDTNSPAAEPAAVEHYQCDFTASPATAARIFDLARQAHYFSGKVDSGNKHVAFSGTKTLAYDASGQEMHATYNYSSNPSVQEITSIFQDISVCLEFGRRLDHDLHYQKLAVEDELKSMEGMVNEGRLKEVFVVAPILQKIVDDSSIMSVSRGRAQRLLAKAATGN